MLVPLQGHEISLNVDEIGFAVMMGYAVDSMMFAPTGHIMDTYGRKYAGVPAFLVLGFGVIVLSFAETYWMLVAACIVMGLGNGLSSGMNMVLGADMAPPAPHTGEFMGVWSLICDAGGMLGPVVSGYILSTSTVGTSAFLTGAVGMMGGIYFLLGVKETLKPNAFRASARTGE